MRALFLVFLVAAACVAASIGSGGPHPHALGKTDPHAPGCGNGFCEANETHANCPSDCCELSGSGGSGWGGCIAACGNGFCEEAEDHANCPGDCCEVGADGYCKAQCGNGFCEVGEDHAGCPSDCCEVGADGACKAVCGNGFCE